MIILGLVGPPQSGKSTVANILARRGFIAWTFGDFPHGHDHARFILAARCLDYLRKSGAAGAVADIADDADAGFIREHGGQIWIIQRPHYLTRAGDAYKGITPTRGDRGLLNDGPLDALYNRVDKLLHDLQDQGHL